MNDKIVEQEHKDEETNVDEIDGSAEEVSTEEEIVIYKKERNPVLKFVIGFVIFLVIVFVTLYAVGFTMGLMKIEPPNLDSEVFTNKWAELTGEEESAPPNELEPAASDGGEH